MLGDPHKRINTTRFVHGNPAPTRGAALWGDFPLSITLLNAVLFHHPNFIFS